jgi:predicted PurR-regulated permease PerM
MNDNVDGFDIEAGQGGTSNSIQLPPEPEINKGFLKPIPETTKMERVAGVVAGGAVATALVAMVIEGSVIVILGGVLSCIVGPYAYWQETRLTDIKALQETERAILAIVESLRVENQRLTKSVDEMTETVTKLDDVENALSVITQTQGNAVETLSKQVQECKDNLERMQSNVKGRILRNLLSLLQRIDTDGDGKGK